MSEKPKTMHWIRPPYQKEYQHVECLGDDCPYCEQEEISKFYKPIFYIPVMLIGFGLVGLFSNFYVAFGMMILLTGSNMEQKYLRSKHGK